MEIKLGDEVEYLLKLGLEVRRIRVVVVGIGLKRLTVRDVGGFEMTRRVKPENVVEIGKEAPKKPATEKTISIKMNVGEAHALLRIVAWGNASRDSIDADKTIASWVANRVLGELRKKDAG